jgi:hypothetical protein
MAQGRDEFARQLTALGYGPMCKGEKRVGFDYDVKGGRLKGTRLRIGLEVEPDFPHTPPPGPHISPHIRPINTSIESHPEKVAPSTFGEEYGGEWQYLSRPCKFWKGNDPVIRYIEFLEYLLSTS